MADIQPRRESLVNGKAEEVRESVSAAPMVSVVIPTFNGAARLPGVLTALAEQDAPGVSFEVIVVDNASTDETGSVIERDPAAAVMASRGIVSRTVHEPRQGLTYARICGVLAARGELVCFLDDDNIPDSDYIANGPPVFRDRVVGLAVSQVRPDWEIEPPASIYRRRHLLAVNDYNGDEPITFTNPIAPTIGAGLWVRREAFLKAVPWQQPHTLIADRLGRGLCGGGDIEIGVLIYRAGYERRYIPQLRLAHRIPATRFESGYMWRLIIGTITGERALHVKYGKGHDRWEVAGAWARLTMAACTIPLFPLMKSDWRREVTFVTADRFARVRGPIAA
jgi:glycosyltransferase involved in cell wall biosynthesis